MNKNYKKLLLTGLLAFGISLSAMDGDDINPEEEVVRQVIRELNALAGPGQTRRAILERRIPGSVIFSGPFFRPLVVSGTSLPVSASKEEELQELTAVETGATSGLTSVGAAEGAEDFGSGAIRHRAIPVTRNNNDSDSSTEEILEHGSGERVIVNNQEEHSDDFSAEDCKNCAKCCLSCATITYICCKMCC